MAPHCTYKTIEILYRLVRPPEKKPSVLGNFEPKLHLDKQKGLLAEKTFDKNLNIVKLKSELLSTARARLAKSGEILFPQSTARARLAKLF